MKLKLPTPNLGQERLALHEKILDFRDQVLAHSDLGVLDASVSYDKNASFPVPLIVSNILSELYSQQGKYDQHYAEKP